jgi:hypothetical protein
MAYLDVITLATAKNYLGIDDTLSEDDADITRMIKGALRYVEEFTNVLVYARDKDFLFQDKEVRVYDHPINTLNTPVLATSTVKPLYTLYKTSLSTDIYLNLNVGYSDPLDVPEDIIDVALEMIELNYYGEKERGAAKKGLSQLSKEVLYMNKRFLL